MQQAATWAAPLERPLQRSNDKVPVIQCTYGPTHNVSGEQVQDDGQIDEARGCAEERHIARPALVRPVRRELPIEQVECNRRTSRRIGSPCPPSTSLAGDALDLHEPHDPLATHGQALILQGPVDSDAAVSLVRLLVSFSTKNAQPAVVSRVLALRASQRSVVSASRYAEHPTQHLHRLRDLFDLDKRKPHAFSLAKNAAAFFKMSRSILSTRFSLRSAASSCRSSVVSAPGEPRPTSTRACLAQLYTDEE